MKIIGVLKINVLFSIGTSIAPRINVLEESQWVAEQPQCVITNRDR
jgi:hypothetical protein